MHPAEPLTHIQRDPLPWRAAEEWLTECGLPASSYPTVTREVIELRLREDGKQRTAMMTCMTCLSAMTRYDYLRSRPGVDRILQTFRREIDRCGFGAQAPAILLSQELRAMMTLIERHDEEFRQILKWSSAAEKRKAKACTCAIRSQRLDP